MKKRIIPVVCTTVMLLASCGGGHSVNKLTISNKTDLQAAWYVGDSSRAIAITADPTTFDVTQAISDGKLTFVSSDTSVVSVAGKMLTPLKAGTSTISVSFEGKTDWDSVVVTVSEVDAAKRYEKYCDACKNATTATIQGTIVNIESYTGGETKGNIYLQEGKYGYRVNSVVLKQGERTLKVGDSVVITGTGYGSSKSYKALKSATTLEFLSTKIDIDEITLDKADYSVSESALVATGENFVTVETNTLSEDGTFHTITYKVGTKTYNVTYNGGSTTVHDALFEAFSKVKPGHKIKAAGTLYADGVLSVGNPKFFSKEAVKVSSITITPFEFDVKYGFLSPMQVEVLPVLADKKEVDYQISGPGAEYIMIVEDAIVISDAKPIPEGGTSVNIKATAKDGSGVSSEEVTFKLGAGYADSPTKINVTSPQPKITKGDEFQMEYSLEGPAGCANMVTWNSSDETVAKVDEDGLVTVLQTGNVTITANSELYPEVEGHVDLTPSFITDDSEPTRLTSTPLVGSTYYLGFYQMNLIPGQQLLITGKEDGNYAGTTRNAAECAQVTVEAGDTEGTYKLKCTLADKTTKYLDAVKNNTYVNAKFVDAPTSTIKWGADLNTFVFTASGDTEERVLGTSSTGTYTTLSFAKVSELESKPQTLSRLYENLDPQVVTAIRILPLAEVQATLSETMYVRSTPENQAISKDIEWTVEGTGENPGEATIEKNTLTSSAKITGVKVGTVKVTATVPGLTPVSTTVKVAERTLASKLTFPGIDQQSISAYDATWTVKDQFKQEYTITGFNNNNNGWSYIKCGSKNAATVASIVSPVFNCSLTSLSFVIDNFSTPEKVNSIKIYKTANLETPNWEEVTTFTDKTKGTKTVDLTGISNMAIKIEFDIQKTGSNGIVQISQVSFNGTF